MDCGPATECWKATSGLTGQQVVAADLSGLDMFTAEAAVCRVEEPEARLASLHSAAEAVLVAELLAGEAGLLGGLVTPTSTHWGDGTEWDYEDWAEGEPGVGTVCSVKHNPVQNTSTCKLTICPLVLVLFNSSTAGECWAAVPGEHR